MARSHPTTRTWKQLGASVAAAGVAAVTVLTLLESDTLGSVVSDGGQRFLITFLSAVVVGRVVWVLAKAEDRQSTERDEAFAKVIADGNDLVALCRSRSNLAEAAEWRATLWQAWEAWDGRALEIVRRWGSAAAIEIYSRARPSSANQPHNIAANVKLRLNGLETVLRSID